MKRQKLWQLLPELKSLFFYMAPSHRANLQSYYLTSEYDSVMFSVFQGIHKVSVYFLTVAKSPPWGQALLMAVVYVCLAPATLH